MDSQSIVLIVAAFLTSTLSGFLGMGGGVLLLAVMALYFPAATLIPLHGAVQFVSNGTRILMNWRHIAWPVLIPLTLGSILGAAACSKLVVNLPDSRHQVVLAVFILIMTWMPKLKAAPRIRGKFFWVGAISTGLSMVVGATGPLVAPFFLHEKLTKESVVATKAGGQAVTHLLKVGVFSFAGFQLGAHAPVFAGMVIAVTLGTACGKVLLGRISERLFLILFRVFITLLAARMLWRGFLG